LRTEARDAEVNLMGPLMEASLARATVGEIMSTLADVFGRYQVSPR
jgi:methylmalonyl-CoA mutase N-terminal domain/subunit